MRSYSPRPPCGQAACALLCEPGHTHCNDFAVAGGLGRGRAGAALHRGAQMEMGGGRGGSRSRWRIAALAAVLTASPAAGPAEEAVALIPEFPRATAGPFPFGAQDLSVWRARVPRIEEVEIPSTADGAGQKALFYDPGRAAPRPLLVVLHSWSEGYLQNIGIPYGIFAERNGWLMIAPDHRGPYRRPEATASELAQRDVLDAIEYAKRRARVDPARVYLVGYSGSAMTALVLAARHPDVFGGVVAWVPIHDLVEWYEELLDRAPGSHYARDIAASCGGPPVRGSRAAEECKRRSPSAHLAGARGRVNVFLGAGIWDQLVPPDHALRAWNELSAPADRIGEDELSQLARTRRIPAGLAGSGGNPLFEQAGVEALLERTSERATVVVFQGSHDLVYNAGLAWLAGKRRD